MSYSAVPSFGSLKNIWTMLLLLLWVFMALEPVLAATKGESGVVKVRTMDGVQLDLYQGSYALLIGVSHYEQWPDLDEVPAELAKVAKALEVHGFTVRTVMDPDSDQMKKAFEDFIQEYGFNQQNRLFFFFSGHGATRESDNMGYLVPADAPHIRKNPTAFKSMALSMSRVLTWCREMEAKHALFLFDSCFSGTIFESKSIHTQPPWITDFTSGPVRYFITAGEADEEVPARSIFTPTFVRGLRGEADYNRDGYITSTEMGMYLHEQVLSYNKGQTPQHGKIKDAKLSEGEFVFVLQNVSQGPVPPPAPARPGSVRIVRPVRPQPPRLPGQNAKNHAEQVNFGHLVINKLEPPQAKLRINGNESSLKVFELSQGAHKVEAFLESYQTFERTVYVHPGEKQSLDVVLEPDFGSLSVESQPEGAEVMLNGLVVGKTPYRNEKVRSGSYTLKLVSDMYLVAEERFDMEPQKEIAKTFKLKPDFGTFTLGCSTEGAKGQLDRKRLEFGKEIRLRPGYYTLVLEAPYHEPVVKSFEVKREQEIRLNLDLKPHVGTLSITTFPAQAWLYLDGRLLPQASPYILETVNAGPHTIEARKKGYEKASRKILVQNGRILRVDFELEIEEPGLMQTVAGWFGWGDEGETKTRGGQGKPAPRTVKTGSKRPKTTQSINTGLGMKFILVSAGSFMMGSNLGFASERPAHRVTISRPYYLQSTEVTQAVWKRVMGVNPSKHKGDDLPVENVSWNEVQEFIRRLNSRAGNAKYRLPSEAEWEYAARAGGGGQYCFGHNEGRLGQYAWYGAVSGGRSRRVGGKKPNAWGFYDMHGNVWEWVQDRFGPYPGRPATDPTGPDTGPHRVNRGGSYVNAACYNRSAYRRMNPAHSKYPDLGLRLARDN